MRTKVDTTLIEAARQIAPVIRNHKEEAERERRLSQPVLAALHEAGLLRMFTPRSLGGLEVDPMTCALVIEEVSGYDSVAGWTLFNPLSYAYLCARLPDRGAEEIYGSGANAFIAGPYNPPMKAIPVRGGYNITGRLPFASNCYDASWTVVTAAVTDADRSRKEASGEPPVVMAFFPSDQCEVIDTWFVMGMRGTGTNDISVTDVFVPKARTFPWVPEYDPGSHYESPLYRFPFMGIMAALIPPIALAVARGAIDEVSALAQGKVPFASAKLLRERASAQSKLAQAEAVLRSGRLFLYDTISEAWEAAVGGEALSLEQRADLLLAMTNAMSSAANAVELMWSVAGTSGIYTRSPLERYFRDLQVLRHHGFAAESRYETVGQVYLGLPADFPVIAF